MQGKMLKFKVSLLIDICLFIYYMEFVACNDHIVKPKCSKDAKFCEFHFNIGYKETMVYHGENEAVANPVVTMKNRLYRRTNCDEHIPLTQEELKSVSTADGSRKFIYSINGQLPGPPIIVYEDQEVVVNVTNNLLSEGVTIHWHGLIQRGTPWMDGVAGVSQCPINPEETFTYRFVARPAGTNWYHSHIGTQRTDGLAGALIILEKEKREDDKRLPIFKKDFHMTLQDWMPRPSNQIYYEHFLNMARFMSGYGSSNTTCYRSTLQPDLTHIGFVPFASGLINGKDYGILDITFSLTGRVVHGAYSDLSRVRFNPGFGHYYPNHGEEAANSALPLETFTVEYGSSYRFRVVNAGMVYAFQVSVDEHHIELIAVDGNDVNVEAAESIIVQPGERVDFMVHADVSKSNYWIRVETLEIGTTHEGIVKPGKVLGILHYEGSPSNQRPRTNRRECTHRHRCRVINCPFGYYPEQAQIDCLNIATLKSTNYEANKHPVPRIDKEEDLEEIFLNFHFASHDGINGIPSVNGKLFKRPSAPFQTYPNSRGFYDSCERKNCTENCYCTHIIYLKKNKVIQLILHNQDETLFDMPHPIHMHGHHFHVVKMAFPDYNRTTGAIENVTADIECDTLKCNNAKWANKRWRGDNIPGLNLINPPLKDTVTVPRNGYAILRLKADNPGYWFMHCHIEIHQVEGMALLFQEGKKSDMPPTPSGFHKCGNFKWDSKEFHKFINNEIISSEFTTSTTSTPKSADTADNNTNRTSPIGLTTLEYILLGIICCLAVLLVVALVTIRRKAYRPSDDDPQREPLISKN